MRLTLHKAFYDNGHESLWTECPGTVHCSAGYDGPAPQKETKQADGSVVVTTAIMPARWDHVIVETV